MTEEQKERYKRNREAKIAETKERARRRETIKSGLEKIVVSEDATISQKLEAARLIAALDGIHH